MQIHCFDWLAECTSELMYSHLAPERSLRLTPRLFSTVIKTKYCVECLQGQRVLKIVLPELLA